MSTDSRDDAFHNINGDGFDVATIHQVIDKAEALNVPLGQTPGMSNEHYNALKAEQKSRSGT